MGEVFWHYYDQELALARWEDPVYGLMPPALFIHVLEENLLIHKLDLHIVRLVCEDYRREVNAGHRFVPVSFNLSRLDFDLCDILDEINQIVLAHEVSRVTEQARQQEAR